MIEIICVKVEEIDDYDFLLMRSGMHEKKKDKVDRFRKRIDAIRTMVGELVVRMHFQKKLNVSFEEIYFVENKYFKPCIGNKENVHFNISHSGEWIAAAFHDQEVGIDIEKIKPVDFKIISDFFSKDEIACFNQTGESEQQDYFYNLWVLKESYVKAIGKGFYEDFSAFSITNGNGDYHCVKDGKVVEEKFTLIQLSDAYKLAICAKNYTDYNLTVTSIKKVINEFKGLKKLSS